MAGRFWARSVLNPQQPAAPPLRQERLLPYFERLCQMELYRRNSQEAVGVLLALLGVYQDLAEPQREERKKEDPRIMEAMALIAAGYHRSEFCAETIARKMAVSRTTLNRLFQKKSAGHQDSICWNIGCSSQKSCCRWG